MDDAIYNKIGSAGAEGVEYQLNYGQRINMVTTSDFIQNGTKPANLMIWY